ncbi:histone PARylation factor 1-like isoform X2 [Stegodyphus dumicola]|uniref:histone PARylation factor 1-like isoform X2 n=1 Tax=Stegodyphus dumicola TaxID=202533 RepID=UPI0015B07B1F|nr:histone PARylation factor 1-like isoform X2 [Stegodyphus dumicola]
MDRKNSRKRKIADKPMCKYGFSCYQKNPEHHKKFTHPVQIENVSFPKTVNGDSVFKLENENEQVENVESTQALQSKKEPRNIENEELSTAETVKEILKSMPEDFFDFWNFCSTVNKSKPEDAFAELGYHLVGVYDILAKKLLDDKKVVLHCHWRYYYDPPEFQTVIKLDGGDLYHIGYFRDDPSELPSILAANNAALDAKLTLVGDNIFAAMNAELIKGIKKVKPKKMKEKFSKIQENLQKFAKEKRYSLEVKTAKTKARDKKVVTKSFHGLGIVVPFKNDIGYRPLPDSNANLKSMLKKIVDAESDAKRLEREESLDELITNVHFANDECDYGMGLELGIDLFCFGHPYFHSHILNLLPLAYDLLKRPKYSEIIKAHLANRREGGQLDDLEV